MRRTCASLLAPTLAALALLLSGCAAGPNPKDPLEPVNRKVYEFNQTIDKYAIKPAAEGYKAAVPPPVRGGITNVFANFRDVTTAINNLLQAKVKTAFSDVGRVLVNTTIGIFGVFDVASHIGLEKHDEDFGQTLGYWGVPDGPYLVLPLFGPSTARDTVGLVGDYFTDPEFYLITDSPENWIVFGVRVVNVRANLLEAERVLDSAAIDRYAFLRDAYLQRRRNLILDGAPAAEDSGKKRKSLKEMEEELDADPDDTVKPEPEPAKP